MKRGVITILTVVGIILIFIFLIRTTSPRELDDLTPGILCELEYLNKSDILWVIPLYNNIPISENKTWCKEVLKLNKTIGMHGIRHSPYREFEQNISQQEMQLGINIFKECFGFEPELFKPPQLAISDKNLKLIDYNNLTYKGKLNQITHKVYHCNDSGILPNSFHDIF